MASTNNRRIAINTAIMYARMLIVMCISFYASRLLLSTLGVTDFGVFSVVGSITISFSAIKSLFSESTQRYLNIAKGSLCFSEEKQRKVFFISLIIHFILALLFFFILEVSGSWLLETKLSIPVARYEAAFFVFQVTIFATVFSILNIPYDAVLIANEKMGFFAFISLYDGLARLLIIFLLPIIGHDYLKIYSLFLLITPITTLFILIQYCKRFPECSYKWSTDKSLFKGMISLSSWNFIGNISFSLIHEGINMLLNVYGGVVLNASRAIAYQVKSMTNQVSNNVLIAVRPRVMQHSVQKDRDLFFDDIFLLSRFSFFILGLVIFPLFLFCPQILTIWLGEYPEETVMFTRLVLIALYIRTLHEPINMMNMSFSKIKRQIIVESIIMILCFLFIYVVFHITTNSTMPFIVLIAMEVLVMFGLSINAKYELGFPLKKYTRNVVIPMCTLLFLSYIAGIIILLNKCDNNLLLLLWVIISIIVELVVIYFLLNLREKRLIFSLLKRK